MSFAEYHQRCGARDAFAQLGLTKFATAAAPDEKSKGAKTAKPKPAPRPNRAGEALGSLIGSSVLSNIGQQGLLRALAPALDTEKPVDAEAIRQKMLPDTAVNIHHEGAIHTRLPGNVGDLTLPVPQDNAFALPDQWGNRNHVATPPNVSEAFAAHELGHIKNHDMLKSLGTPGRVLQGANALTGLAAGISSPVTSIMSAASENPSWTPGLVNLGLHAPRLLDEAMASAHATRYLMGEHGVPGGLYEARHLLPAFGTYALGASSPLIITGLRKAWRKYHGIPDTNTEAAPNEA